MICLLKVTENQARKCFNIFSKQEFIFWYKKVTKGRIAGKKTPNQTSVLKNHIFHIYLKSDAFTTGGKNKEENPPTVS